VKKFFIILGLSLLLAFSTFGESESESSQILLTGASGSNVDIDGNEQFDALTDGLLVLRSMFGLTGTSLISGSIAGDATYTDATDIESRITGLGNRLDIDDNGNIDALTDGLIVLRYLFGLTGDTLVKGVVAADANRVSAAEIEAHMAVLTSLDTEPPVITSSANYTAAENQTTIGTATATDANSASISFTVSGFDLEITSDGVLSFATAPDYETKSTYTAVITATDGTNLTTQSITVNVTDVDDVAPAFSSSATLSGAENQTAIGTVTATDVDTDNSAITFTVSGSELSLTSAGVLTFASAPDYETKTSYTATVTATDGTNSTTQSITVNVSDVDDVAPAFSSSATFNAAENQTAIGTVAATDVDTSDSSISFTVSGSELSITSAGVLTFASAPDYETKTSYTATVTATDGANSATQSITVNVTNLNDNSPAFTSSATFSAAENQTSIGTVTATDGDAGDSVTFTVSGSELLITSAGVLTFASAPDYETTTSYTATVTATDGANSATQSITVNVTNLNDNSPAFTSSATFSAAENQTSIGTVTATDGDASDSVTFTVSGSELSITSAGVLTFASAPDYETKTSYTATVTATDGTNSTTQSITVSVTNLNDNSPVFTSSASLSANENQTTIGTVAASDADGNTLSYSISGTDASSMGINSSSGALTFNSAPDYETKSSYSVIAAASDGTNSTTQNITVSVVDVNEAPAFTSSATFSANEKQTSIGTVTATDVESNTLSYSVTGTDASAITINSSTGVLTFNTGPDYETKSSYSVTVAVTDGVSSTTQAITISINETEFEVGGTAYSSKYYVMDGDILNTDYVTNDNSNNLIAGAQAIQNPTLVSGYTGHSGDAYDLYVVSTSANMYANLDVVDYASGSKDLDLRIYNSDGSNRSYTYVSGSTEANETINLPSSGTYLIQVAAVTGQSSYLLSVGQRLTQSSLTSGDSEFVPNEILSYIPFTETLPVKIKNQQIENLQNKARLKSFTSLQLPMSTLESTPALRKINSSFLINSFRLQIEGLANDELEISEKQKLYLSHWKAIQKLKEINPLANYELNYVVKQMATFSADPYYAYQWNLKQINLEAALNAIGQEVKNIAVAVIDSGSPTVNSAAWNSTNFISGGYDFVKNTSNGDGNGIDNDPTDPDASLSSGNSHGTHVATTIGMKNNGAYFNGMAVKVLPLRVFPTKAAGQTGVNGTMFDLKQAVLYAAGLTNDSGTVAPTTTPIKVINLSLTGGGVETCDVYADVVAQGITVVAASGNNALESPGYINYPASCNNVISVGATNSLDARAAYSQFNSGVDIAAPGGQAGMDADGNSVDDTVLAWARNSNYAGLQGTSMASPHIAGGIALMYSIDSDMTPAKVNTYLQAGYLTDDIGASGPDTSFGYGRLNLAKAVENTLVQLGDSSTTFFASNTSYANFGSATTQINITISKVGNASLSVSSLSADDGTGFSYTSSVDSNGAGTYTIYLNRGSIPNGEFQNRLYFNLSNSAKISIGLYYKVGSDRSRANLGKVFVGLYNSSNSLTASGELSLDGSLSFLGNDIVDGNYYFIVSTDVDDDGYVCDVGELCEYYPEYGSSPSYFTVNGTDTSGGQIVLSPIWNYGGINAASVGEKLVKRDDRKRPRGDVDRKISRVEALDNGELVDAENTAIPNDAISINSD